MRCLLNMDKIKTTKGLLYPKTKTFNLIIIHDFGSAAAKDDK